LRPIVETTATAVELRREWKSSGMSMNTPGVHWWWDLSLVRGGSVVRGLFREIGTDQFGHERNIHRSRGVHLDERTDTEHADLMAPELRVGTVPIQMSRISFATVVPLLREGDGEKTADLDKRPRQTAYQR
jgi:hypothetical protein